MEYRIFYDFCDENGNEEKDCQQSFIGSWTELQNEIKEMKKQGCYNIDATAISEDNMDEDINDEFRKRGWRMTKNFQMGKGAWENLGTFSADGGSGAGMCCGESLEEDADGKIVEASAMELVKKVKKPAKKRGITVKSGNTDMGANIAHFNKVSAPVDTAAVASDMGIGVGLAGGSADAGGDGGCCGGESLNNKKGNNLLNEENSAILAQNRDKINYLANAIRTQLAKREWTPFKVRNPEEGLNIRVVPIGDNITSESDCEGFDLFDVADDKNNLLAKNLPTILSVAKYIVLYESTDPNKEESLNENYCFELFNGSESLGVSKAFFDKASCKEAAEHEMKSCKEDGMTDCKDLHYIIKMCGDTFDQTESLQEEYNPELQQLCKDINAYLGEHGCLEECWVDNNTIRCEIIWGDWKHDHLRCTTLVQECLFDKGYECDVDQVVTEEDGSDTYSAIHIFKNISPIELPEMEQPEEPEIKGTLRENLERLDAGSQNKYDLVQYYDALSMTMDKVKKQKLYDLLYGKDAAKNIYEILSKDFEEII